MERVTVNEYLQSRREQAMGERRETLTQDEIYDIEHNATIVLRLMEMGLLEKFKATMEEWSEEREQ